MRIAIFNDYQLPLPAVKGGSVASLINFILDQNEIEQKLDIDVYSCWNKTAEAAARKYKHTRFIYSKDAERVRFKTNLKFVLKNKCHIPFDLSSIPMPASSKKFFQNQKYDVVYISGYVRGALPIIEIAKQNGAKVIVHHHTVTDYLNDPSIKGAEIIEKSDAVIFVSEFAANYARTGTPEQNRKIHVFENAIDTERFAFADRTAVREEIRGKYGIEENDIVVLFVGRIVENKGTYELIRAVNPLQSEKRIVLLVIGGATYSSTKVSPYVQKCLDEGKNKSNVFFTGYVDYEDMPKYYVAADISTLISRYNEACGLVGLESMAAGLPVITTDRGGIGEYVSEECKIVVGDGEDIEQRITTALLKLCDNPELCKIMGESGMKRASLFNKKDYYSKFITLLESVTQ